MFNKKNAEQVAVVAAGTIVASVILYGADRITTSIVAAFRNRKNKKNETAPAAQPEMKTAASH